MTFTICDFFCSLSKMVKKSLFVFVGFPICITLMCFSKTLLCQEISEDQSKTHFSEIYLYQNLFKVKRKEHLATVQKLILVKDVSKLASLLKVTFDKIIETISKSITLLQMNDYVSGKPFPEDLMVREELSKVLENTAFFTDLIVRFPKPSHIFYKRNKKMWKKIMKEAINVCEYSTVFDGDYTTLLHNLKQELEIGPKDETYTNPFYKYDEVEDYLTSEERRELYEAAKRKKKLLEKKSKRTGPKMTGHSDL